MKILVLCPGKIAESPDSIRCFTDVLNYYLPMSLAKTADVIAVPVPSTDNEQLKQVFSTIEVDQYDAILTLGLRFYSTISKETTALIRNRFKGIFCQTHDGSRLDYDPVDITFTFKNEDSKLQDNPGWYARHKKFNRYMGWASDPTANTPKQHPTDLRILVDHTNYGNNKIDCTREILNQIGVFIKSEHWKQQFKSVSVRRFDSGCVVDVDFDNLQINKYNRTAVPFSEIVKEHNVAHVFCVTHPESVGLVVLETAMAGALAVVPKGFVPRDRLDTVRHVEWENTINWKQVLENINIEASRSMAIKNTWESMASRIQQSLAVEIQSRSING